MVISLFQKNTKISQGNIALIEIWKNTISKKVTNAKTHDSISLLFCFFINTSHKLLQYRRLAELIFLRCIIRFNQICTSMFHTVKCKFVIWNHLFETIWNNVLWKSINFILLHPSTPLIVNAVCDLQEHEIYGFSNKWFQITNCVHNQGGRGV